MAKRRTKPYRTHLDRWMRAKGVKPAYFAREIGYSRQHLLRVRQGEMEPTRPFIAACVAAARRLTDKRIKASELFELGEDDRS